MSLKNSFSGNVAWRAGTL